MGRGIEEGLKREKGLRMEVGGREAGWGGGGKRPAFL